MAAPRWIDLNSTEVVTQFLTEASLLDSGESVVALQPAGDGNMNVTLRATIANESRSTHATRTLIVKQSRPFVAKYDRIAAPIERIEYEAAFYEFAASHPAIAQAMPKQLAWIPEQHLLVLQDLGPAADATSLYASPASTSASNDSNSKQSDALPACVPELVEWLTNLHRASRGNVEVERFRNLKLRSLNHQHMFVIPFQDPAAVDLDAVCSGLNAASVQVRTNANLRVKCSDLGRIYLSEGECLLHGDFYPGSWLLCEGTARVIDPEFCFVGPPEFDLGVLLAHLKMIGCIDAERQLEKLLHNHNLDWELVRGFAAVEVLRRLLGVAQLPLAIDLPKRLELIRQASDTLVRNSGGIGQTA